MCSAATAAAATRITRKGKKDGFCDGVKYMDTDHNHCCI